MSPEQILGEGVLDGRADLYALGVLTFEMLTGRMPFEGLSDVELLRKHLEDPIPDPRQYAPEMKPEVAAVIRQAMAKKPELRFLDVYRFLAALEEALGVSPMRPKSSGARWLARVFGLGQ
jgi:serine/threonine-protein kinase